LSALIHHSGNAHPVANGLKNDREEALDTKLYLTMAAIVAILYALAFLLIPVQASLFFSSFAEPRAVLYLRFVVPQF
jgi:hypothetical protein